MLFELSTYQNGEQVQDFSGLANLFETEFKSTFEALQEVAEIVRSGIEQNLQSGLDFAGGAVAPLKPSTIKQKGHSRVFYDTGVLFQSVMKERVANDEYGIFISGNRSTIAAALQQGRPDMEARQFFGIGGNMETKIEQVLNKELQKL